MSTPTLPGARPRDVHGHRARYRVSDLDYARPRRRYYRLTEDGAERARLALAQARTPVSAMELRVRSAGGLA